MSTSDSSKSYPHCGEYFIGYAKLTKQLNRPSDAHSRILSDSDETPFEPEEVFDWQSYTSVLQPYELFTGPNAATRHDADHLPDPVDPFLPQDGENFAAYPLGNEAERDNFPRTAPELKVRLGYDSLGRKVVIKVLKRDSTELRICRYLQDQRRHHPDSRDHTIPILDIICADDWSFIVMPEWSSPTIPYNVGEYIDWLRQLLEGLAYLHDHGIAHRDLSSANILLSLGLSMYTEGKPFLSTFAARFAFIDFGHSTQFPKEAESKRRLVLGSRGTPGYKAPELSNSVPFDPFRADVYSLAYCIMHDMYEYKDVSPVPELIHHVCPELSHLLADMTVECPECRPTAAEALSRLEDIIRNTPETVLRSPGCDWKCGGQALRLFRTRVARHRQGVVIWNS